MRTVLKTIGVILGLALLSGVGLLGIQYKLAPGEAAAMTGGQLGSLRGAIETYKQETGHFPKRLEELTSADGKYLMPGPFPQVRMFRGKPHKDRISTVYYGTKANDAGGWIYDNQEASPDFGKVWVNCTHTDPRGVGWSSY